MSFEGRKADSNVVINVEIDDKPSGITTYPDSAAKIEGNLPSDKNSEAPSPLLQFFAEEKCGKDTEGLAFFEQIAAENKAQVFNDENIPPGVSSVDEDQDFDLTKISGLQIGETDDICNAWIPCEKTKRVLCSIRAHSSELYHVEKEMITTPTLIIIESLEDPIKIMMDEIGSGSLQRHVVTAAGVSADAEGLKRLISSGFYHSAVNLTTLILKSHSVGNTCIVPPSPESLQLWFIRIALLLKLKKFSLAEVESETFGNLDNPDLYYEFHGDKYNSKKGCMVPFSLRLLFAEIPQYNNNYEAALNKLYALYHVITGIKKNITSGIAEDGNKEELSETRRNASLQFWTRRESRVLYSILNCFLSQRDYTMAIKVAENLLEIDITHTVQLYSAIGRIYLQLGDVRSAQECFNSAFNQDDTKNKQQIHYEMIINKALLAVALGESDKAYNLYKEALAFRPGDPLLTNNLSVCLLYMGKLKESLSMLEQAINKNPKAYLHDNIMFNICTLYELESSYCTTKKQALLKLVSKYASDSFSVSSLKIPVTSKN